MRPNRRHFHRLNYQPKCCRDATKTQRHPSMAHADAFSTVDFSYFQRKPHRCAPSRCTRFLVPPFSNHSVFFIFIKSNLLDFKRRGLKGQATNQRSFCPNKSKKSWFSPWYFPSLKTKRCQCVTAPEISAPNHSLLKCDGDKESHSEDDQLRQRWAGPLLGSIEERNEDSDFGFSEKASDRLPFV